ncbi:MAG TPA: sigma-70 family RNA polymerase sigma factor [Armatimonadota bacterium]|jgi:RNA polymerase sigma-70 factor (ECF subfamily)
MLDDAREAYSDDARLVSRSLTGDQAAFRQLYEAYAPFVYRLTLRMLANPDDAADLTQEIFVRAYQRLHTVRDGTAFQAWLTRLAVNMTHDRARRAKPVQVPFDEEFADGVALAATADGEERVLAGERSAQLHAALRALSNEHRLVVILHHLEDKPVEEISALLQIPVGTVKSRLGRARAELRKRLAGYFDVVSAG